MKLTRAGIKDRAAWEKAGITLPGYDVEAVSEKAKGPGEKGRACGSGYLPRSGGRPAAGVGKPRRCGYDRRTGRK